MSKPRVKIGAGQLLLLAILASSCGGDVDGQGPTGPGPSGSSFDVVCEIAAVDGVPRPAPRPTSVTVVIGQVVTFRASIAITVGAPFTYEWYEEPINGASTLVGRQATNEREHLIQHTFATAGSKRMTANVIATSGVIGSRSCDVTVSARPGL